MPTVQEIRQKKIMETTLRHKGIAAELSMTPVPKTQWYRADGVPMPNLLPADPYHMSLYTQKGWTVIPPENLQPADSWKPLRQREPDTASQHIHRYGKKSGSECSYDGCTEIRKMTYKPRG
jgi:hypothetical protein